MFFFLAVLGTHGIVEVDLDILVSAWTSVDFKESHIQILREQDEPYSSGSRAEWESQGLSTLCIKDVTLKPRDRAHNSRNLCSCCVWQTLRQRHIGHGWTYGTLCQCA